MIFKNDKETEPKTRKEKVDEQIEKEKKEKLLKIEQMYKDLANDEDFD